MNTLMLTVMNFVFRGAVADFLIEGGYIFTQPSDISRHNFNLIPCQMSCGFTCETPSFATRHLTKTIK